MPQRKSFIFYRQFFDAIRALPAHVQAEVYPAVAEYALLGKAPLSLSPQALSAFATIRPALDRDLHHYLAGIKGAPHGVKGGRPRKSPRPAPVPLPPAPVVTPPPEPPTAPPPEPPLSAYGPVHHMDIDREVDEMLTDTIWRDNIRALHRVDDATLDTWLSQFRLQCRAEGMATGHVSIRDAKSHFNNWLRIRLKEQKNDTDRQRNSTQRRGNILPPDAKKNYGDTF